MKIGGKNKVKINPLAYNIGLIGESGIGKTTLIKDVCRKLVGDDGYLFIETGHEDGGEAIEGLNRVNCPEWSIDEEDWEYDDDGNIITIGFEDVVDDIIENKTTDYPDLKVVIIDTLDDLFTIVEPEVIRMSNRENPEKQVKSIKAAFGGFQAGEDKAIDLVVDKLWSLKKVGVSFIVIGHTKTKEKTDTVTNETYSMLTTNMSNKYFNAIKNKLHFLGVAYIDRTIMREKTGKKNIVTKKEETIGRIKSEERKIRFRDDNYSLDSKVRFADIISEIPLDADAFINALTDAIKAEQAKSSVDFDKAKQNQEKAEAENLKKVAEKEEKNRADKALNKELDKIKAFIKDNKSELDKIKPLVAKAKEMGFDNPTKVDTIEAAQEILKLID